jgi:hypothetical protein
MLIVDIFRVSKMNRSSGSDERVELLPDNGTGFKKACIEKYEGLLSVPCALQFPAAAEIGT